MKKRIGSLLLEKGKLKPVDLERALRLQESSNSERIGTLLLRSGVVSEHDFAEALAEQLGTDVVETEAYPDLPILEEQVGARFLKESRVLPIQESDTAITLAMIDPLDSYVVDAFALLTQRNVTVKVAVQQEFYAAFDRLYGTGQSSLGEIIDDIETREEGVENADIEQLKELASEAPVIRLVNLVIRNAMQARASDIHIEPFENRLIVRYRVDGVMHEVESPPQRISDAIISRIKIMANMDIAERRLPQDGRIMLRIEGKELDLRVSSVPTMHGESVVMRILDKSGTAHEFTALGFDEKTLESYLAALKQPNGIILVTGPTGSGKTTTLYTSLQMLNKPDVKILTVEDPVEYQMEGINQIQVKPQIGLTFAKALRSIVRQDPDIIMIGEIRDPETAQIAVRSALTGHRVLSTVHTNDAPSTINRMLDMGMEDYLLTSTIVGILAQRLVRTLCIHCRELKKLSFQLIEELGLHCYTKNGDLETYHAVGCENCAQTGYLGRVNIIEMLSMTDAIRGLVMRNANAGEIRNLAIQEGMHTMFDNGMAKVMSGVTTIEEVLRVTRED